MPHDVHVLIVEDVEEIRRAMVRTLRQMIETRGFSVVISEADLADAAFEKILSNPGDRWFVITDNNLEPSRGPIQTGLDLIRHVHENVPRIRSFLVLMSGGDMDSVNFDLFGVDRFMQKPCKIAELVELLATFLASE